jgi:hypothetical protein
MSRTVFHKYEKYWKNKKYLKNQSPLDWFDIKCLAESLLSSDERKHMEHCIFYETFIEQLVEASKSTNYENIVESLKTTKMNLNFYSLEGLTPLQTVAKMGNNELMHILLQHDANPNMIDIRHGYSPLQICAMNNNHTCLVTLLANNANISYINTTNGRTALHYACEGGNVECIKELLNSRELNIIKKRENQKEITSTLNVKDQYGLTALHLAVIDGNIQCVKLLVEVGGLFICVAIQNVFVVCDFIWRLVDNILSLLSCYVTL